MVDALLLDQFHAVQTLAIPGDRLPAEELVPRRVNGYNSVEQRREIDRPLLKAAKGRDARNPVLLSDGLL